ncbi:MAG: putative DNA binding domain-containing protein [Cyanobacteria bacterium MAG CAR1_bin_15]|nr:putative DNA binding domain-containing protein [Cyanobacteria bacterium MAG CAR1_bin_15]
MPSILPVNLEDLLACRGVESQRVEFKAGWDPKTTGFQVLRTICAFANDLQNLNGGYVVIGVAEQGGRAIFPPPGLTDQAVEAAQKWIRGQCNRLDPPYQPLLSPETVADRRLLVVWAPGSETRPHRAPARDGSPRYWVRLGTETVDADQRGNLLSSLMEQAARVPWDDRRAMDATIEDLREAKVREFLHDVGSGLLNEPDTGVVYQHMRLTAPVNGHQAPRNVGLLFFSHDPLRWFRGAKIEVVQFTADRAGDVQEERTFSGALADQVRDCLGYLENLSTAHLQKQQDRSQVRGWVSYPLPALRETLVNAVYHRSYAADQPEPTKVYLYPGRIEVISYPGPVPGIEASHLALNASTPPVPARNRRIGEFLKELGLAEGRHTGLPKVFQAMAANGSPAPRFQFDEQRTFFQATLPAHPEYEALSALRDAAHLRVLGASEEALHRLESAWAVNPAAGVLAAELIREYGKRGEVQQSEAVLDTFAAEGPQGVLPHLRNVLANVLMDAGKPEKARQLLWKNSSLLFGQDAIDAAILARRLRDPLAAHQHFQRAGDAINADPRALLEFAQTKLQLSGKARRARREDSRRRFLREARTLLERVLQLSAPPTRHAWAWRELARTLHWLGAPARDVEDAYQKAIALLPEEARFVQELQERRRR